MLQTALIFRDHVILQREKPLKVWGTADPGAQVEVSIQGRKAVCTADADGAWCALLEPLEVSLQEQMVIRAGEEIMTLADIQVGDVWLAGGQSNMEFHMRYDADMQESLKTCEDDSLRFFDYPEVSYPGQLEEHDYLKNYGFWRKAAPDQLERFSAAAFYFARRIRKTVGVPVGIIGCNWGGSPACAWMTREHIAAGGGQVFLDEYEEAVKNLDLDAYWAAFKTNPMNDRSDQLADPIGDLMLFGCTMEEFAAKLAEMGVDLSAMDPAAFLPPVGPGYERRPSALYENMLTQVAPYALKGFLYYQGETDGDTHPECYKTLFPELIRNWRELWGEELPFLFVQIAPLEQWMQCNGTPYAIIRAAQQHTADTVPGTGMVSTSDVGMQWDIHPKKKQPVGERLALLAEKLVYGKGVVCDAPILRSVEKAQTENGAELVLYFDDAADGLSLSSVTPYGEEIRADQLGGLVLKQQDAEGIWQELDLSAATAQAAGNEVRIRGVSYDAGKPVCAELAQTGWYQVNLYNSAGLPARPSAAKTQE